MNTQALIKTFTKKFSNKKLTQSRGIGIECEFPIVNHKGEAVSHDIVLQLFNSLLNNGFQLKRDFYTNSVIAATRVNLDSSPFFEYFIDTITTDLGYSTLEIALAPQKNLFIIHEQLNNLLFLIVEFLSQKNCRLLGYGIHPITHPSKKLLVPHKYYNFKGRFSENKFVPKSDGKDFHLLTVSASNQCHVSLCQKEMIIATNILNAFSGLQIVLNANSPIWRGKIDKQYKANRELFWDFCFPDRLHQAGIPKKFNSIEDYIETLASFKSQRVMRNGNAYRIVSQKSFKEFLKNTSLTIGENRLGDREEITPSIEDIHTMNLFCYYNARLVSKFGTIESRMSCQQPPNETLTTAALTLGIIENLGKSKKLMNSFSWKSWQELRLDAIKHSFKAKINEQSVVLLIKQLLDIAREGLINRQLGEEHFLNPLYHRLASLKSPADIAIDIFKEKGLTAFLKAFSYKKEDIYPTRLSLT